MREPKGYTMIKSVIFLASALVIVSTGDVGAQVAEGADTEVQASAQPEEAPPEAEPEAVEEGSVVDEAGPVTPPSVAAATPPSAEYRLRFSSIRLYRGGELEMAPAGTSDFESVCELPCITRSEGGAFNLNVRLEDGREYALPNSLHFDADTDISLKYGASAGAWAGGIMALTGIVGVLITGGIAIAGAAQDDSGLVVGGLVGFALSSALFGGGLITFLLSERGLRAEVSPGE